MKKMWMIADTCWPSEVKIEYGAFFDVNEAMRKARELAEEDARNEHGRVEPKNNDFTKNLEFWVYWKNGSHCFTVVPIDTK